MPPRIKIALLAIVLFTQTAWTAPATIEEAVRDYYEGVLKGHAVSWDIDVRRIPNVKGTFEIMGVRGEEQRDPPRGMRVCWVKLKEGTHERDLPITLTIKPVERVPLARQDINSRTAITPDMFEWQEISTQKFGATHIANQSDLSGAWAKVHIPAGSVITGRRIAKMPKVVIGQPLKLVIRIGSIEATAEGKALEDGRVGEKIRVLNLVSGVRLYGRVAADGTVTVE